MILENDVIKYNQVPDFIKSTEVSRKLDMKLKKGRASYHKSSLDENVIIDKLVLSPIIVRAKLLKIIKTKKNTSASGELQVSGTLPSWENSSKN